MNQFEMVAIVVLIAVVGGVIKSILSSRQQQPLKPSGREEDKAEEPTQQIRQLEKRIQVLEQIVTSDGYDLKQRFRELNDKPGESDHGS